MDRSGGRLGNAGISGERRNKKTWRKESQGWWQVCKVTGSLDMYLKNFVRQQAKITVYVMEDR